MHQSSPGETNQKDSSYVRGELMDWLILDHIGESRSSLLSLLIEMLVSSGNTFRRHSQKQSFTSYLGVP